MYLRIAYLSDFEVFIHILLTLLAKNCLHTVTNTFWLVYVSKWLSWFLRMFYTASQENTRANSKRYTVRLKPGAV